MSWAGLSAYVPILSIFLVLHLVILPYLCSDLPFSLYSKQNLKSKVPEDDLDLVMPEGHAHFPKVHSDMAILVLTAARDQGYLNRTLLSLYKEMSTASKSYQVYFCTAELVHAELGRMPWIPGVTLLLPCIENRCAHFTEKEREQKIVHDFAVCHEEVEEHLGSEINYLLWLEDDVMLMSSFFPTLSSILAFQSPKLSANPWLDIKLYLFPRLRGYAWDMMPLVELLATCSLLTLLLELILNQTQIRKPRNGFFRHFLLYTMVFITLMTISRQHITQWRRIHPQLYAWRQAPNFGTQAVVYNRTTLKSAVAYLKTESEKSALDLAISSYRHTSGLMGYLLEPNLVRHIGMKSSMGGSHQMDRDKGDIREFMVNYSI